MTLVNTVGNGLWVTVGALYLTRVVGLSATGVGLGMTIAAAVCLAASAPMGYLADRRGPRGMQSLSYTVLAVLSVAMLAVRSFGAFVAVAALTAVADAGQRGARGALIAGSVPPDRRVIARAYLRATTNVGLALGAALGGVTLAADTPLAYRLMIVGNAASFLVAAVSALRLPAVPPVPRGSGGPHLVALRDRPYLIFVVVDGLMSMHGGLLNVVLPLWIATRTSAPRWLVAVVFLVNTSMVVLLQVRTARGTDEVPGAIRAARRAGLFLGLGCLGYAASAHLSTVAASALLMAGALAHVLGELLQAAAGWGISFGLAPAHAQGQYQATYSMGLQLGNMIAPAALTWLLLGHGLLGWLALAIVFVVLGAVVRPVVGWAVRERTAGDPATGGATTAEAPIEAAATP